MDPAGDLDDAPLARRAPSTIDDNDSDDEVDIDIANAVTNGQCAVFVNLLTRVSTSSIRICCAILHTVDHARATSDLQPIRSILDSGRCRSRAQAAALASAIDSSAKAIVSLGYVELLDLVGAETVTRWCLGAQSAGILSAAARVYDYKAPYRGGAVAARLMTNGAAPTSAAMAAVFNRFAPDPRAPEVVAVFDRWRGAPELQAALAGIPTYCAGAAWGL